VKKQNKFLHIPQIAGGTGAFKKYIENNLIYPKEALEKRIGGTVLLIAEIDDNGKILHVEIIKGLEGGCNDEAIRLIKNVRFGGVKNKGLRLKAKKRFSIKFKLPVENKVNYQIVNQKEEAPSKGITKTYSYTIQIN